MQMRKTCQYQPHQAVLHSTDIVSSSETLAFVGYHMYVRAHEENLANRTFGANYVTRGNGGRDLRNLERI